MITAVSQPSSRQFRITDIPLVMQYQKQWPVAARLMRRWFQSPGRPITLREKQNVYGTTMPPSLIDHGTVTMDWVLRFARVRVAYDQLLSSWDSPKAREKIVGDVRKAIKFGKDDWRFGDFTKSTYEVDQSCAANFKTVGGLSDPLDDFYGAIGKGTLKVAVTALVSKQTNGRHHIQIDEIAMYLRDTYDFNDDMSLYSQPLGYWGWTGVERNLQLRWDIAIDDLPAHPTHQTISFTRSRMKTFGPTGRNMVAAAISSSTAI